MSRLMDLINTDLEVKDWVSLTMDWSEFDVNCPAWLINDAFDIVENMIDFSKMSNLGKGFSFSEDKANQYRKAFKWIRWNFINTKIMDFDGKVYRKDHGVPSGSYFTQLIDSVINKIVCSFLLKASNCKILKDRYLGDDSLIFLSSPDFEGLDLSILSKMAKVFFHFKLNPKKVKVNDKTGGIHFLGYQSIGNRFVRDDDDWFRSAVYTEQVVTDLFVSASRLFSFYILGGCNSITFSLFFDYFLNYYEIGDKPFKFEPTIGIKRIFKYVIGREIDTSEGTSINFDLINYLFVPFALSRGYPVMLNK